MGAPGELTCAKSGGLHVILRMGLPGFLGFLSASPCTKPPLAMHRVTVVMLFKFYSNLCPLCRLMVVGSRGNIVLETDIEVVLVNYGNYE